MQDQNTQGHSRHDQQREYESRAPPQLPSVNLGGRAESYGAEALSPGSDANLMPYLPTHNAESMAPIELMNTASGYYRSPATGAALAGQFSPSTMHNPKRAYRQRRKDPSCDACRERKVKCDATDTASCTECSSRNVRCQFTKDTNRRMSSIKQVQDLERQLQEARSQLERVRASDHLADQQTQYNAISLEPEVPDVSRSPRRMLKARSPQDLSAARAQLSDVGRGILKPPIAPSTPDHPERHTPSVGLFPPRDVSQICLDSYLACVHQRISLVYWPRFCQQFWGLYSDEVALDTPRETVGLCFGVLALGALFSQDSGIRDMSWTLLNTTFSYLDFFVDKIGTDQGIVTFLIGMYMAEINKKSACLVWLASSVRIVQDRGLHVQGGHWSSVDGEMRKRVWYTVYVWDRLMAAELGRPMLINDEDCDTEYPDLLEEEQNTTDLHHPLNPTLLLASIHVARLLAPLARLCRSLCITSEATKRFEAHLGACMSLFPAQLQLGASGHLDPSTMAPLLYFQNVRILLYRHNMSPACSSEQRSSAIDNCAAAASDTADIISRCFLESISADNIENHLRTSASFLTCTHLWRCMLFLAFRRDWTAFHILLRFAALIGDSKPINISCGRHLSLFLRLLFERHQQNVLPNLEEDEDLIVLLSGDLQAGTNSWVWGNAETGTLLSKRQKHSRSSQLKHEIRPASRSATESMSWDSFLSDEEMQQWGGWERIHEVAQWLDKVQRGQQTKLPLSSMRNQQSPELQRTGSQSGVEARVVSAKSRMTIASITDL